MLGPWDIVVSHLGMHGPCHHEAFQYSQELAGEKLKGNRLVFRVSISWFLPFGCLCFDLSFGGNMLDYFKLLVTLFLVTQELKGRISLIPCKMETLDLQLVGKF